SPPHLFTTSYAVWRPLPRSTLFPYTTLFRSHVELAVAVDVAEVEEAGEQAVGRVEGGWPESAVAVAQADSDAAGGVRPSGRAARSEEHTSELQSLTNLVCRLLLEKTKT